MDNDIYRGILAIMASFATLVFAVFASIAVGFFFGAGYGFASLACFALLFSAMLVLAFRQAR